jgi:hypothetical protein
MAARAKGAGRPKGAGQAQAPATPAKRTKPATPAQRTKPAAPAKRTKPATSAKPATPAPPAPPVAPEDSRPPGLLVAAAAQVIEAAGLCVAAAFGAVSTADGKSSQVTSGVGLTVLAVVVAAGVALAAIAVARGRPWSRTPTVMTQLFVIIGGIVLLDGQRPEWGVPALALAAACLAGLFTPASLRALNRPPR